MQKEKKIQSEKIVTLDSQKMNQNNFKKSKSNHNIYSIHPIFKLLLYVPEQQKKNENEHKPTKLNVIKNLRQTTQHVYVTLYYIQFGSARFDCCCCCFFF